MKLVREHINEKFVEDSDPVSDMGIGMMYQIKQWMKSIDKDFIDKDQALIICSEYGKLDFVKYLLTAGTNVHTDNDDALRWASYNGHANIVKVLLAAGANVHANNDALIRANYKGHVDVVRILKNHIAKEKKKRVKESLNEKFTEDSDPVADMNIGSIRELERLPELFGEADKEKYIYTIHVEDDFVDFWFWHHNINKIELKGKKKEQMLFDHVVNIINDLGFSKFLVNPKMILYTDSEQYIKDRLIITCPGIVRFVISPNARNLIPIASYRRSIFHEDKIVYYEEVDPKDRYLINMKKYQHGLTEENI